MNYLAPIGFCILVLVSVAVGDDKIHPAVQSLTDERCPVPVAVQQDLSDGVLLETVVAMPKNKGTFPAILIRSPYSAAGGDTWLYEFARTFRSLGYAVVIQDCRGTGGSTGNWLPFSNEHEDGKAAIEWVLAQPWSNGRVATFGGSYTGFTQWAAVPLLGEKVAASLTTVPAIDWHRLCYVGGAYRLRINRVWDAMMARPRHGQPSYLIRTENGVRLRHGDWHDAFHHLPLMSWDRAMNMDIPWTKDVIAAPQSKAPLWNRSNTSQNIGKQVAPNLTITGWYDLFLNQSLENAPTLRRKSSNHRLLIGPWGHYMTEVGTRGFGEESSFDAVSTYTRWFQHWIDGAENGVDEWPYLRIFVMGANKWRDEHEWPLKRAVVTPYYFHSKGDANTGAGDGRLDTDQRNSEDHDKFVYDPNGPVPSLGGEESFGLAIAGPVDQRPVEKRNDVLVYSSNALEAPIEVTGPVKVILYAATDRRDTDWTAKLVDVYPDGRAFNLCEGIIRARYRNSDSKQELLEPNRTYRYEIDLWATSNVFEEGHRIRVEISSSNFPRFDRNPNTGNPFGVDSQVLPAHQTVFHDRMRPSHIELPIVAPDPGG